MCKVGIYKNYFGGMFTIFVAIATTSVVLQKNIEMMCIISPLSSTQIQSFINLAYILF